MTTTTYRVEGMTCEHCVRSVSSEVSKLSGVTDVAVSLETGEVTVTSAAPLDDDDIRSAVDEAGYELAR